MDIFTSYEPHGLGAFESLDGKLEQECEGWVVRSREAGGRGPLWSDVMPRLVALDGGSICSGKTVLEVCTHATLRAHGIRTELSVCLCARMCAASSERAVGLSGCSRRSMRRWLTSPTAMRQRYAQTDMLRLSSAIQSWRLVASVLVLQRLSHMPATATVSQALEAVPLPVAPHCLLRCTRKTLSAPSTPTQVALIDHNIASYAVPTANARAAHLNWGTDAARAAKSGDDDALRVPPGGYDCILASQVVYVPQAIEPLVQTIAALLAPGGVALLYNDAVSCMSTQQECRSLLQVALEAHALRAGAALTQDGGPWRLPSGVSFPHDDAYLFLIRHEACREGPASPRAPPAPIPPASGAAPGAGGAAVAAEVPEAAGSSVPPAPRVPSSQPSASAELLLEALRALSTEARDLYVGNDVARLAGPPDPLVFHRRYVAMQRPVLLTDCVADWPALRLWSHDYLRTRLDGAPVHVAVTPNGLADAVIADPASGSRVFAKPCEQHMPFSAFVDALESPLHDPRTGRRRRPVYYCSHQNGSLEREFGPLWGDVERSIAWADRAFGGVRIGARIGARIGDDRERSPHAM